MNNLSIEELKEMREMAQVGLQRRTVLALDELIAIRELKGEQVTVANPVLAYADSYRAMARQGSDSVPIWGVITDLERNIAPLFAAPQKPVVVLTDCDIGAVSHMAHWYSEEQCEAWVAGVEHAKKQIVAAGCIVQTGATDKEDDHQSSAPAVLHDVLTAVSIGGSRKELIDALTAIKPKFGAPGSRDVDVRAAQVAIDKAIEKLSNL